MIMTYSNLNSGDLRGLTVADYLISIEADFQICDGSLVVYEEPFFPVVELARSLHIWVLRGEGRDFVLDSLSFEEPGAVTIVRGDSGWVFGSMFTPEVSSSEVGWSEVQECIVEFETRVWTDLAALGIEMDRVLRG